MLNTPLEMKMNGHPNLFRVSLRDYTEAVCRKLLVDAGVTGGGFKFAAISGCYVGCTLSGAVKAVCDELGTGTPSMAVR
jgi:hypothetical protein